jgi:hypothetical protein
MSERVQAMNETNKTHDHGASVRRIRFVDQIADGNAVLMSFQDPSPRYAVLAGSETHEDATGVRGEELEVVLLPLSVAPQGTQPGFAKWLAKTNGADAPPPVLVKLRGVELMWRPGHAIVQCDAEQAESLLAAVAEFAHYERELRRIEREIADSWTELEQDKPLAFEVTPDDLKRGDAVGERMNRTLQRRIRMARIEPHLYDPDTGLPAAGQKLGEELRDKARMDARLETVDAQLEVFEGIYEMSGQRMGEFRAAQQEHVLEWTIIALLGAELLLMLAQALWKFGG